MSLLQFEKAYGISYNSSLKRGGGPVAPIGRTQKILVIGGIVAVVLTVLLLAGTLVNNRGGSSKDVAQVAAHLTVMEGLSKEAKKYIQNGEMNKVNTTANLLFTTDKNNLNTVLTQVYKAGVTPEQLAKATNANTATNLQNARLLNKYDITYRATMQQQVNSALTDAYKAQKSVGKKQAKEAVNKTVTDLESVRKQLDELEF